MDPLGEAVKIFGEIFEKIEDDAEIQKKFRARARNFPSFMNQVGIAAGIAYLAAKAEKAGYKAALEFLEKGEVQGNIGSEKISYGLYLYALLRYLGPLVGIGDLVERAKGSLLEAVKTVKGKSYLHDLILPFIVNLKLLAEANLEKEEE